MVNLPSLSVEAVNAALAESAGDNVTFALRSGSLVTMLFNWPVTTVSFFSSAALVGSMGARGDCAESKFAQAKNSAADRIVFVNIYGKPHDYPT